MKTRELRAELTPPSCQHHRPYRLTGLCQRIDSSTSPAPHEDREQRAELAPPSASTSLPAVWLLLVTLIRPSWVTWAQRTSCNPPARNESHCYSFTFWVQPLSQRGCCHVSILGFQRHQFLQSFLHEKETLVAHRKIV